MIEKKLKTLAAINIIVANRYNRLSKTIIIIQDYFYPRLTE
jgi:hypothetical protein